jgi:hypothetical protein
MVRACLAGGAPLPPIGRDPLHLVDLSRARFDSLSLPPVPGAVGRPLAFALAHPDRGATLPGLTAGRVVPASMMAVLAAVLLGMAWVGVRPRWLPAVWTAWLPLAGLSLVLWRGWPSLSNPVVYPPQGRDMVLAALPALLLLLASTAWAVRRWRTILVAVGAPGLLLATVTLGVLFACGGVAALLGGARPPLDPRFTGPASFLLAVSAAAFPGFVLAALAGLAASRWWPAPAAAAPPIAGSPPASPG